MLHIKIFLSGIGGKKGSVEQCTTCHGSGMQVQIQQLGPGMLQHLQSICPDCKGQGDRINPRDRCKQCGGRKTIRDRKILEVHVDPGMVHNQRIVFAGEGDQEPDYEPGDIMIVLEEKEHEIFKLVFYIIVMFNIITFNSIVSYLDYNAC